MQVQDINIEEIIFENKLPFTIQVQKITKTPIHWHENVTEIILPLNGSITVVTNFEKNIVHEGDFLFVNNNSIHSIFSSSDGNETLTAIIYIDLNYFENQFEHIKYMFFRSNLYTENSFGLIDSNNFDNDIRSDYKMRFRNLLINIIYSRKDGSILTQEVLRIFEYQLIYSMVNEFNWLKFMRITNKYFVSSVQLDRYHRTVKFILEHYAEKISLEDIVAREFITKTYFSHFWKSFTSFSFRERLNYERVLKSEFLLLQNKNIALISEQCGFSDVKYYYKSFKKWYGCMPKEHKMRCFSYMDTVTENHYIDLLEVEDILDLYANQYYMLQCNQDSELSNFIENYMKLNELYRIERKLNVNTSKYIQIDPFQYSGYHLEKNSIIFDWQNMDLCVNLAMDIGFTLYLKLNCDNIMNGLIYETINNFIDGCIFRYGIKTVKKWHFFINYRNVSLFDYTDNIKRLLDNKVNDVKISYSFEF